tara:strand:+ start:202 stop:1443 length:1242 start_codon:yes stop_codon:yes gene_type:complete
MTRGRFILTPGVECDEDNTTKHYSVFATQNTNSPDEAKETKEIFSDPQVCGALFLQHHMMSYCTHARKHIALPREDIIRNIQSVQAVNAFRVNNGHTPIFCAFDAEPAPVQARRYVHNPPEWPIDPFEQAEYLYQQVQSGAFSKFIEDVIGQKGYYPMLPSNQTLGLIAEKDVHKALIIAQAVGSITGRVMGALGINMLFAPVCDLGAQAFPERCYSKDKQITIGLATAWCKGALDQEGIDKICLKHAPGHGVEINRGSTNNQDTHNTECYTHEPVESIGKHLSVFREIIDQITESGYDPKAITVMTNHIIYTAIDALDPVSSSSQVIQYLKENLPDGIDLIADCINMASFSKDRNLFVERLKQCRDLHSGGVIATTHYVKQMGRRELLSLDKDHATTHQELFCSNGIEYGKS